MIIDGAIKTIEPIFLFSKRICKARTFSIENEIRKKLPIIYLNIWDDLPAPYYNQAFYESCDALLGISKQTVNINKLVLGDKVKNKIIEYVPHGLNDELFYPIQNKEQDKEFTEFKKQLFKGKEYEFVAFFNSRNIRRKQVPDTILAFSQFVQQLPKDKAGKCALVLHTELISEHGTDLIAVIETLVPKDVNIIFTPGRLDHKAMNYLYNLADVQMLKLYHRLFRLLKFLHLKMLRQYLWLIVLITLPKTSHLKW